MAELKTMLAAVKLSDLSGNAQIEGCTIIPSKVAVTLGVPMLCESTDRQMLLDKFVRPPDTGPDPTP